MPVGRGGLVGKTARGWGNTYEVVDLGCADGVEEVDGELEEED